MRNTESGPSCIRLCPALFCTLLLPHCCHYRGGLIQGDRPSIDMSHLRCGVLVTPRGAPGCANGSSLGVGNLDPSARSLTLGKSPRKNCPNKSGNHPLPPGIEAPLE